MVKHKIVRIAAATAASAGLIAGFSGVAAAHPYHDSHGTSTVTLTNTKTVSKNNVGVYNHVDQNSNSGDAKVIGSKYSHSSSSTNSASTGNASNSSSFSVNGTVKNNANTEPDTTTTSSGTSDKNLTVTNTKTISVNNVTVANNIHQDAHSGDALVVGGSGGSATTGNASNSSSSSVTLNVSN